MGILMFMDFIKLTFIDVIDILLVTYLFFYLYKIIKGTVAFNIFIGLLILYLLYYIVALLNMELLSELFGQFISVGFIALIILFQPEIRQFLLYIGKSNPLNKTNILRWRASERINALPKIGTIVKACKHMAGTYTGALIIIAKEHQLEEYVQTGERIEADTSEELIETIFFKNTPLHDGALIINKQMMVAARCILPVTQRDVPSELGLRHRSAIGITEQTDCIAIVVSEQTGSISYCMEGHITRNVTPKELEQFLKKQFITTQ